jgi:hypothetical protein
MMPRPAGNARKALPMAAPDAAVGSVARIPCPGVGEVGQQVANRDLAECRIDLAADLAN